MSEAFRGEFNQKVDGKARVTIPARFRAVLEAGDPNYPANDRARFVLVYGGDNRAYLECYSIAEMKRLEARILRMPLGDRRRTYLVRNMMTLSLEVEIDEDGRIVLPPKGRDKIGIGAEALKDGAETVFAGMLNTFQIWNRPAYEADLSRQAAAAEDVLGAGEDMLSLLPGDDEPEG